jgi:hypothetical protein
MVKAQGWFQVLASHRLHISVHVTESKYTHHARAWGFAVPIYEWPFPMLVQGWSEQMTASGFSLGFRELLSGTVDALRGADAGLAPPPSGPAQGGCPRAHAI